jgi:hypothetical protein
MQKCETPTMEKVMQVEHKVLSTGYHHVRAIGYAHLYAQWPMGTRLTFDAISTGEGFVRDETLAEFIEQAERAASSG